MAKCVKCNGESPADSDFCINCGAKMPKSGAAAAASSGVRTSTPVFELPRPRLKPSVAGIAAICSILLGGFIWHFEGTNYVACQNLGSLGDSNAGGCGPYEVWTLFGVVFALVGVGLGIYALVRLQKAKPRNPTTSAAPIGPAAPPGWYPVKGMSGWFTWWDGTKWGEPQQRPEGAVSPVQEN